MILTINAKSLKKGKEANNMIWTIHSFSDKYLLSGDSNGVLTVWDSVYGVMLKEFREHEADILTICSNKNTGTVYFTGSDSLVCSIQMIKDEWTLTSKFRGQSHDINSLVLMK